MKSWEQDREDRRRLRGDYAPPIGICRVCGGKVAARIAFRDDGKIGGPPRPGYIKDWSCEACGLMYSKCPPPAA